MSGIYVIANSRNAKVYVGSAVTPRRREAEHWRQLSRGKHYNARLQAAWLKYGEASFFFLVVEGVTDAARLIEREQAWLDGLRAANPAFGYNILPTADNMLGHKLTPEQRAAISARQTGIPFSAERRATLWGPDRQVTDAMREACRKTGRAQAGIPKPASVRAAVSKRQTGSRNCRAKLTEADVAQIKRRLLAGERVTAIARSVGISHSIVSNIKTGKIWTHVTI